MSVVYACVCVRGAHTCTGIYVNVRTVLDVNIFFLYCLRQRILSSTLYTRLSDSPNSGEILLYPSHLMIRGL